MEQIRIVIADDEPVVRRGLRMLLGLDPRLQVIGEAGNGLEAVEITTRLTPDVILMDVRMSGMDGITATSDIVSHHPEAVVLILTMQDDAQTHAAALKAGAAGLIPKHLVGEALLPAINRLTAKPSTSASN